ncbi:hypothetical protein H4R24_002645 [Coemansia sp. RSA 988]|nr:hypothetical protein H4R24_002645 [Coemansia sp. RSA 988]
MTEEIGYAHPHVLAISPIAAKDKELQALVGNTRYYSITYRLFETGVHDKTKQDDFTATYLGTIEGHEDKYELGINNAFIKDTPKPVCH